MKKPGKGGRIDPLLELQLMHTKVLFASRKLLLKGDIAGAVGQNRWATRCAEWIRELHARGDAGAAPTA